MNFTPFSFKAAIDIGKCQFCEAEVSIVFDFCGKCWKKFKGFEKTSWFRTIAADNQRNRRRYRREQDDVSLDRIVSALQTKGLL